MSETNPELENLRGELDEVNTETIILFSELVRLFVKRSTIVDQVAVVKEREGIDTYQPERFKAMTERLVPIGTDAGLSEEYVRAQIDLAHNESIRQQDASRALPETASVRD